MQITATREEKLKVVYSCLCSGLPYFVDYGFTLDYNKADYNAAHKRLREKQAAGTWVGSCSTICLEDVQTEMLRGGATLKFKGGEGNKSSHVTPLNLEVVDANWDKVDKRHLMDTINENDDANSTDCVMQGLLFGEIVYG